MIDTHTHLYFPDYGDEISEVMQRCIDSGVTHFILPNVDLESIPHVKDLHDKYKGITSMAMGLHPSDVKEDWSDVVDIMEKEIETGEYIAIGEIGIDLHWEKENINLQQQAFERQLRLAEKHQLPVIIHSREAVEETLEVIQKVGPTVPLIFHSFTGNSEDVEKIRKVCDPYFGINGVVTYKNAPALREAVPVIGINRMVMETDAPYLSPVPHRGERNDSSFMYLVRDKIAEVLSITPQEVEDITTHNARSIFGI